MVSNGARMGLPAMLDPEHLGVLGPVSNASDDVNRALALAPDHDLLLSPTVLTLPERVTTPPEPNTVPAPQKTPRQRATATRVGANS